MQTDVEPLSFHAPFDWDGLLEFFQPRAVAGVEAVSGGEIRRSLRIGGVTGTISVSLLPNQQQLQLSIIGDDSFRAYRPEIAALARRVLDLDCDPSRPKACLSADPALAALLERWPGIRLPGAWDGFEMGVRAILGQQVSVKAAHTLAGRLVERYGLDHACPFRDVRRLFPLAAEVAKIHLDDLAAVGLTRKRAETLIHFARWWIKEPCERGGLIDLPGIGPWTENYIRMRGGCDANAFPGADLGIQKALGIRDLGPTLAARTAEARSLTWSPWRAYAVMLLWRSRSLPKETLPKETLSKENPGQ